MWLAGCYGRLHHQDLWWLRFRLDVHICLHLSAALSSVTYEYRTYLEPFQPVPCPHTTRILRYVRHDGHDEGSIAGQLCIYNTTLVLPIIHVEHVLPIHVKHVLLMPCQVLPGSATLQSAVCRLRNLGPAPTELAPSPTGITSVIHEISRKLDSSTVR